MSSTSLDAFIHTASAAWPAGGSQLVDACRAGLAKLARANAFEPWLAQLLSERPATRELHRHPSHGFVLLAHTENQGLYRPPHDHGRAWVVYAVQSGALEVGTYAVQTDGSGERTLVEKDRSILRAGEARAYLPGEVHDTRCLTETALLLRFTERDLRHEDQVEGKVTRFVERDGRWTAPCL